MKQKAVPAGEFKNSCLKIMDTVHKSGIPITVTKRGKPLVRVVPAREAQALKTLKGVIVHESADIFSTDETWEADS